MFCSPLASRSFSGTHVLFSPRFIGFDNFIRLLTDPKLWFYLYNTVFLMIRLAPVPSGGSLLLAIVLSQKLRGIIIYRTVFYLPTVTNGVALFLLWKWLLQPQVRPRQFCAAARALLALLLARRACRGTRAGRLSPTIPSAQGHV